MATLTECGECIPENVERARRKQSITSLYIRMYASLDKE